MKCKQFSSASYHIFFPLNFNSPENIGQAACEFTVDILAYISLVLFPLILVLVKVLVLATVILMEFYVP